MTTLLRIGWYLQLAFCAMICSRIPAQTAPMLILVIGVAIALDAT